MKYGLEKKKTNHWFTALFWAHLIATWQQPDRPLLCHVEDDPTVAFHFSGSIFGYPKIWMVCLQPNKQITVILPISDSLFPPGSPMVSPWPYGMPQMSPMSPMTPMTPMVWGSSAANPVGLPQNGHESGEESWFLLVHGEKPWFLDVNPDVCYVRSADSDRFMWLKSQYVSNNIGKSPYFIVKLLRIPSL